ncbi:response regulator transcription factor [Mitsuokella sp. AF21-1AC]|uniref:response regulator transcription factor n=1 Tax=Mitsuokella sp. AF21-1AC TaxID=2292235 RepID=UPI000E488117|nr:response regulator transcription factor [Mitsuokella sp. AF21-1AC]RGS70262.1 DNA-binding response regulator [Mitsuokella sp. AF21-1AC]
MKTILIVEDDDKIAEIEQDYLQANGFATERSSDGRKGLSMALQGDYALILLDIMLPGLDGFAICQELRRKKETPVLMVTARQEEVDILKGLGAGADDYIMKPFNPNELVARVKSHIRRFESIIASSRPHVHVIRCGDLEIQQDAYRVLLRGKEIPFTRREFEVLSFLAENPDIIFSRETLFEKVWGCEAMGDSATVMVHINRIREKIEDDPAHPKYLETVRGVGYRFRRL